MVKKLGKHAQVMVGEETSPGTSVSVTEDLGIMQEASANLTADVQEINALGARTAQEVINNGIEMSTDLTFNYQHGRFLKYILGDGMTETTTTGDTVHTWTDATIEIDPPSATVELAYSGTSAFSKTFTGGRIGSVTMALAKDSVLNSKINLSYMNLSTGTTASSYTINAAKVFPKVMGSAKLDGTEIGEVQNFEYTIDSKLATLKKIGTLNPSAIDLNEISVNGKLSVAFEDHTLLSKMIGGTTVGSSIADGYFELETTNGVTLGSGKKNFYIKIDNSHMNNYTETAKIGDYTFADFQFKGIINTLTSTDSIATY